MTSLLLLVQESGVFKLSNGSKEWMAKWKESWNCAFCGGILSMDVQTTMVYSVDTLNGLVEVLASAKFELLVIDIQNHFNQSSSTRVSLEQHH